MTKSSFLGGALSFKGDKKKKKSKKSKTKHKLKEEGTVEEVSRSSPQQGRDDSNRAEEEFLSSSDEIEDDDELTDAEKKALKFKKHRQKEESIKIAKKSHRERVEDLNEKLGQMTELNDIPRVSAAGNG
mmetsp:Transcript_16221/g.33337  ORF Transcript_16221/g.33337 Transcript_16221/m.33337 type:complete len:129 (+) Transcript_16221:83-469(+)|eukprot:CAMPEP_0201121256 /NCGR_PEP_ID=MMETSP0850-20130426/5165_1 /ASSEMBLY_ACC=CAM_ASM_000622 /TAXON_ID=183588 /ORGANISM="Pseudo-nitzschia fraudulenta, Strain WWA7" /LENGTH=128 /DNA_ID=CAMNT_0047387649 /DNA_START=82 /DNA_END=468 /DNA_ORIENTATION=-